MVVIVLTDFIELLILVVTVVIELGVVFSIRLARKHWRPYEACQTFASLRCFMRSVPFLECSPSAAPNVPILINPEFQMATCVGRTSVLYLILIKYECVTMKLIFLRACSKIDDGKYIYKA
jgi:hypothetical protein